MVDQSNEGIAFMMGLKVWVPGPPSPPNTTIHVQSEVREWLEDSGITDWELRWVDVSDPKDIVSDIPEKRRHTLETALVFKNPSDAVLFKMAMAGRVKAPDANIPKRPWTGITSI